MSSPKKPTVRPGRRVLAPGSVFSTPDEQYNGTIHSVTADKCYIRFDDERSKLYWFPPSMVKPWAKAYKRTKAEGKHTTPAVAAPSSAPASASTKRKASVEKSSSKRPKPGTPASTAAQRQQRTSGAGGKAHLTVTHAVNRIKLADNDVAGGTRHEGKATPVSAAEQQKQTAADDSKSRRPGVTPSTAYHDDVAVPFAEEATIETGAVVTDSAGASHDASASQAAIDGAGKPDPEAGIPRVREEHVPTSQAAVTQPHLSPLSWPQLYAYGLMMLGAIVQNALKATCNMPGAGQQQREGTRRQ